MLKLILKNPEDVLQKCIHFTKEYLESNPEDWSKKSPITTEEITSDITKTFEKAPSINRRTTVPDELVSDLLELLCEVPSTERQQVQSRYNQQKQVEMSMGDFLEMYILKHAFQYGWIQSGNCIRGTDMIKKNDDGSWFKLQIKNSDNTPNSSSAGFIRSKKATPWARRHSTKKGTYYWDEFPDTNVSQHLSEIDFKNCIFHYYNSLSK